MPGTPATTPKLLIPRYALTDPADFPAHYNAGVDRIETRLYVPIVGTPGDLSSLPSSPYDGQEVIYRLFSGPGSIYWHLRWDSTTGDSLGWRCIGGAPYVAEVITPQTTSSTTWTDLTTVGPQVTIPLAGDYVISYWAGANYTGANDAYVGLKIGAAAESTNDQIIESSNASGDDRTMMRTVVKTVAAGDVVKMRYQVFPGTSTSFRARGLSVLPQRVG